MEYAVKKNNFCFLCWEEIIDTANDTFKDSVWERGKRWKDPCSK